MNRSPAPRRRKPLARSEPPARGAVPRPSTPPRRPQRKTLGEAERARRTAVREAVIRRDRVCILNPGTANRTYIDRLREPHRCFGARETMHHLKKAGQGGEYTFENLVLACAGLNGEIEDRPGWAHSLGLVKRAGDA